MWYETHIWIKSVKIILKLVNKLILNFNDAVKYLNNQTLIYLFFVIATQTFIIEIIFFVYTTLKGWDHSAGAASNATPPGAGKVKGKTAWQLGSPGSWCLTWVAWSLG